MEENINIKKVARKRINLNKGKGIDGPVCQTLILIMMAFIIFTVVLPLVITIMLSLKTPLEFQQSFWTWPKTPMWSNYANGFKGIGRNMLNSIIVYSIIAFGSVTISSVAAYIFVRHEFPGKEFLFSLILALMIIPGILTLTPSFLTVINLNLDDSWWGLILPAISGQQIGTIFMFRTFMAQQPKDLYESAVVEGAGDFVMYSKICVPLAIPIMTIQLVGIFAGMYNDYMWPYLVIENREIQTLMPILKELAAELTGTTGQPGASYAAYLISGIPLIFTTAFGLKFFINGDFAAGLKL